MIVQSIVMPQQQVQISTTVEVGRAQDLADAPVEPLHKPVGLGVPRRRKQTVNIHLRTQPVELVQ